MHRSTKLFIVAAVVVLLPITVVAIMSLPSEVKSGTIEDIRWTLFPKDDGKVLLELRDDYEGCVHEITAKPTGNGAEVMYYTISNKDIGGSRIKFLRYDHGKIYADSWSGEVLPYAEAMKQARSMFVEWMAKIQKAECDSATKGEKP